MVPRIFVRNRCREMHLNTFLEAVSDLRAACDNACICMKDIAVVIFWHGLVLPVNVTV